MAFPAIFSHHMPEQLVQRSTKPPAPVLARIPVPVLRWQVAAAMRCHSHGEMRGALP